MSPRLSTRLVYRVEHSDPDQWSARKADAAIALASRDIGPGPWSTTREDEGLFNPYVLEANDMPTPRADDIEGGAKGRLCALRTRADVQRWFGPDRYLLHDAGFVLRTYEVPEMFVEDGRTQVVFDPEAATPLQRESLL